MLQITVRLEHDNYKTISAHYFRVAHFMLQIYMGVYIFAQCSSKFHEYFNIEFGIMQIHLFPRQ